MKFPRMLSAALYSRRLTVGVLALLTPWQLMAQTNTDNWHQVPQSTDPLLAELDVPADAATNGMWSSVFDWPMNGLHSILLADGRVLTFGTTGDGEDQDGRTYDVWNPWLGTGERAHNTVFDPNRADSFCSAAVYLEDGTLMISGGNDETTSLLYDSETHSTTEAPVDMAEARWYPTIVTLPDGRPLIMGGMVPYTEKMQNYPDFAVARGWASMTPEIYEDGQWRSLFGAHSRLAFGPDYLRTSYPRAWVAPDGRVFGISAEQMWYLDPNADGGAGAIESAGEFKGPFQRVNPPNNGATSTAVMYAPGKILQVGGNGGFNGDELPGSDQATVVDITNIDPVLIEQPPMQYPRRYPNSIVLANGEVVITGGATYGNNYAQQDAEAVLATEIWNPTSGTWRTTAPAAIYRGYHSITALLTNGAILSTGGGTPGPVTNLNGEIYYPPYLFRESATGAELAPRPRIERINNLSFIPGDALQIQMRAGDSVADMTLLGVSNGTHSFNSGQRRIPLGFTTQGDTVSATIPDGSTAPPGYYQLVVLDDDGVPSHGLIIALGENQEIPPATAEPFYPPELEADITTPTIGAGQTVQYELPPSNAGTTYSWNFGDGTVTGYSIDSAVEHAYEAPGLYLVTVTARSLTRQRAVRTFLQVVSTPSTQNQPNASGNLVVEQHGTGERVWVANPDNNQVSVIDGATHRVLAEIPVGENPRSLAVAPNGRVWVSNKHSSSISVIDPQSLQVERSIALPRASQPHGVVFSPTRAEAFVALDATGRILKLNANTGDVLGSVALEPSIRHLTISADGNRLFATRFITPPLPGEFTDNISTLGQGGQVFVVDATDLSRERTIAVAYSNTVDTEISGAGIPNYLHALAISPDGTQAWLPSKQDNIARGMLRSGQNLDFQNTVRAIASRLDLNRLTELADERLDLDNASVASAAKFHPNGVYLFIALETSREVALVNALSGTELLRIDTGHAPQGLAISGDGKTLYVQEFMDRTVSVFDLAPLIDHGELDIQPVTTVNTVSREKLSAQVLRGKQLFYDARDPRLAEDAYMSCATCHSEAGQDGRVWDLTGFGEGLRNTIALRGRAGIRQGLLHWSGNFNEIQDFEKQIRDLAGGTGLMDDRDFNAGTRATPLGDNKAGISSDLDALAAYLNSLNEFEPSPHRSASGSLTASAQNGERLFVQECGACHGGEHFSNSKDESAMRNIGTIALASGQRLGGDFLAVDVPTLRDVWATAPYLHDGSAATVVEAILAHDEVNLSASEMGDVVAYVNQIGDTRYPEDEPDQEEAGAVHPAMLLWLALIAAIRLRRRRVLH